MAVIYVYGRRERRQMRRNRIFRDRNHPFELFDDVELFQKFRFRRHDILEITDEVSDAIQKTNRKGTVPPLLSDDSTALLCKLSLFKTCAGNSSTFLKQQPAE